MLVLESVEGRIDVGIFSTLFKKSRALHQILGLPDISSTILADDTSDVGRLPSLLPRGGSVFGAVR